MNELKASKEIIKKPKNNGSDVSKKEKKMSMKNLAKLLVLNESQKNINSDINKMEENISDLTKTEKRKRVTQKAIKQIQREFKQLKESIEQNYNKLKQDINDPDEKTIVNQVEEDTNQPKEFNKLMIKQKKKWELVFKIVPSYFLINPYKNTLKNSKDHCLASEERA